MSEKASKILYLALSLLVAIVLWLYVDNENDNTAPKQFNNLPIEFIGAEDTLPNRNLMLSSGADATLDLRVSGPRTLISSLNRDDIRVQVDLSGINTTGTHTRTINIYYPDNVDRSKITEEYQSRSAVTVQVSPLYSRTVPVNVTPIGVDSLEDDYIYMSTLLVVEPSTLTISGSEEDVDQVAAARVVLDLTGASATVQREFDYELLDSEGNVVSSDGIRVSSKRVDVTAPIYLSKELPLTVKFKQSPGSMESDISWDLSEDSVTVAGEAASLEGVEEILLDEVDLSTLLSDTEIPLKIGIPAGCENSSGITTTNLSIRFSRTLETRTFSVSNIIPTGLAEGQSFSRLTNSLDVLLRGPASELEEVTEEDIRVVVDLTEYGNGTQYVPATVYVDGHSSVGAVGTYTVAGKISS